MATMADNAYMNVPADRMEIKDNLLIAWNGNQMVAVADVGCVLYARIDKKPEACVNG